MELLFKDRLAPITSSLHFLETNSEVASQAFLEWESLLEKQNQRGGSVLKRRVTGNLKTALLTLLPLTNVERRRSLFVPTTSSWTAYFDNGWQGADAGAVEYLSGASQLNCRAVRVVTIPHKLRTEGQQKLGRFGATILAVYSGEKGDFPHHTSRVISLAHEGQWDFDTFGIPFPFEDNERYRAKRKRERFTFEMLRDYLLHIGIRAFDEDFYLPQSSGEAILVEKVGAMYPTTKEYSLDEAREHF